MKRIIAVSCLCLFIAVAFQTGSCKKSGGEINPLSSVSNNGTGAYLVLDSVINATLNSQQLATSAVGVLVHAYPGGEEVDKVILFATTGSSLDTTTWHLVKTIAYTAPATVLSVTGAELATALGEDDSTLIAGSSYTIYTRVVTKTGKTYDVVNTGDNAGSGLISGSDYHSLFFFSASFLCPFEAAGDYTITRDDWQDYVPLPAIITGAVTDGPGPNQLSLHVYPGPAAGIETGPMIVDVDPATGNATIEKSNIGTYGGSATTVTGSGHVFSCTGIISLSVDFVIGGAEQGSYAMVIQKN